MKTSESFFHDVRGLRYHVRRWAHAGAPRMVLLHGWMDVSASFQFLVDALRSQWDVYAPDWRGYGLTEWDRADSYWFADYIADLDRILDIIGPDQPVNLVGHSLGGNVACMYAGIRPARVSRLVNLEGFGMAPTRPEQAPGRYARWLDELRDPPGLRPYAGFAELVDRLRKGNPALPASAPISWRGTGAGRAMPGRFSCAAIRLTKSSIPCSTATRKCAPAGNRSARRCCGSMRPIPTP